MAENKRSTVTEVVKPQEEVKEHEVITLVRDLPNIVANNIADVMRDRSAMKVLDNALDAYLATLSDDEKREKKQQMRDQLNNGRLAMEAVMQRLLVSIG